MSRIGQLQAISRVAPFGDEVSTGSESVVMSPSDSATVRIYRFDQRGGWHWPRHQHREHQLVWSPVGAVTVETDEHSWLVPPALGLWLPAYVPHAVSATRTHRVYCVYAEPDHCPVTWTEATAVAVGPYLRESILRLAEPDLPDDQRQRTELAMFDVIRPAWDSTLGIPTPTDPRLRTIARALMSRPDDARGLEHWAAEVGAGTRTLTRLFVTETGMTFSQWRRLVRVRAALPLLARGAAVATAGRAVGYQSSSAFVQSFATVTGQTPGAYLAAAQVASGTRRNRPMRVVPAGGEGH